MRTILATLVLAALVPALAAGAPPYQLDPATWQRAVLTEIMVAPEGVLAEAGQWIEIQNLQDEPVNLQGMVLTTSSGGFHVISPTRELVLPPGGVATLGRLDDPDGNGGVALDQPYGDDLLLGRESDVILLLQGNALVDFAVYGPDAVAVEPGRTLSLEPPSGDGFKAWCPGRLPYGDGTNRGTPGQANTWCDGDGDGLAEDEGDCDDGDPTVALGMPELCNGIDDDCDGDTDEDVVPTIACLGLGICAGTLPSCRGAAGWACEYPEGFESEETRCDEVDNDCDGDTDEGHDLDGAALGTTCRSPGRCGAGVVTCRVDGTAATCSTMPDGPDPQDAPEACDDIDNDCDGDTDEDFDVGGACRTGMGACARAGVLACDALAGLVCVAPPVTPAPERCGDGVDNDCNGQTDEGFDVGAVCWVGQGACRTVGKTRCTDDGTTTTCQAVPGTPGVERCGDGIDNDCDGDTDEADCQAPSTPPGCAAGNGRADGRVPLALLGLAIAAVARRRRARQRPNSSAEPIRNR